MVGIIFSSLALAAALGCVVLVTLEGKRSRERNAADMERSKKRDETWAAYTKRMEGWICGTERRIVALEKGTVPDHEKAKAAAKAMDEFHQGLANILNYDPYEAAKRSREGENG